MDDDGEFADDILVGQLGLLQAVSCCVSTCKNATRYLIKTYISVVNLPSLKAAMKVGVKRKALSVRFPCELLLAS